MNHCHRYFLPFIKESLIGNKNANFLLKLKIFIFYFLQTTRMYPDTFTACEFSNWMTVWQNASLLMYNFLFMHMEDFLTRVGLNECVFSPFISSHTHNKTQFEDAAPFNPTSLHNRNAGTHIFKRLLSSNVWGFFYDASFGSFWRIAKLCHDRGNSYCAYFTPAINCQTFNKHDSSFCIWHTALGLHHPKSLAAAVALVGMALSWKIATAVKPVISFEKSSLICSLNSQGCFSG